MIISEEMTRKNISILDFYNVENKKTVLGILSIKVPIDILIHIIDFAGVRFTTYSGSHSDYYKLKINSIISWPKWRERNGYTTYNISETAIECLKKYARREIEKEKLSLIIYGF